MTKKIVCLGDSITYGYGAYTEDAWPARTGALTGLSLMNCGVNGDTAAGMLWRFYEDVVEKQPDICIIMAGANDLLNGRSPEETADTVKAITEKAKRYGIVPAVATPVNIDRKQLYTGWPSARGPKDTEKMFSILAQKLRAFDKDGIRVMDVQTEYRKRMEKCRPYGPWYQDGVHPTREGYHILGEIFAGFIQAYGWCGHRCADMFRLTE